MHLGFIKQLPTLRGLDEHRFPWAYCVIPNFLYSTSNVVHSVGESKAQNCRCLIPQK